MNRKIDDLGRIGIPKAAREELKISAGSSFIITWDERKGQILLQKESPFCAICGNSIELKIKNGVYLCKECFVKLFQE